MSSWRIPPIADHALLSDRHTAALVGSDGSVRWLCLPRFDSGACFASLLDPDGGSCDVGLDGEASAAPERRYLDGTVVLETTLHHADGEARVLDLLVDDGAERGDERLLLRVIEGVSGTVPIRVRISPRFDYGIVRPWIRRHEGRWSAIGGDDGLLIFGDAPLEADGRHDLAARFTVGADERVRLALAFRRPADLERDDAVPDRDALDAALEATIDRWRSWSERDRASGTAGAHRSALALKALTFAPSGAMVAAATTSLPEGHHGERAWDYRFSWIRDSVLASRSLTDLGYDDEAEAFRRFIERSAAGTADQLQVFYGVGGERRAPEQQIEHLCGWEGATVNIGNGAAEQLQLDAFGHLLSQSWNAWTRDRPPDAELWHFIADCVDAAAGRWEQPDAGIWEMRGDGRHFVYSKVMCWAACDRGLRLAEACGFNAPTDRWAAARDAIAAAVHEHGYEERRGTFVQAFGSAALDAAVLRLPASGFIAYDDPRMVSTVDVIARGLDDGGLLRRYDSDDGLPGREGAFLACTFWLVECLAGQGRTDEAQAWFDRAAGTANDLGLFSEEYDTEGGRMLGNFPQALTHLAHIEAALALVASRG